MQLDDNMILDLLRQQGRPVRAASVGVYRMDGLEQLTFAAERALERHRPVRHRVLGARKKIDAARSGLCHAATMNERRIVPAKLQVGDEVRVIAPSRSLAMIGTETREIADARFRDLGLHLTFGLHVEACDQFVSTTISRRVDDLHEAFGDPNVKAVITVIGGYNANQLLPYIDWDLIAENPKIFCGYSDITALGCAIYATTGLVTYSGPHYSTFGMRRHFERTGAWFAAALLADGPVDVEPADTWTDDQWFLDQEHRNVRSNEGYWVMQPGDAEGTLIGGNLCTFNLLQGTRYMPDLRDAIVFIEDDFESQPVTFDRDLTSLTQQPGFDQVRAMLIGRFQAQVGMTRAMLAAILASKRELAGMPIVANLDFGHTDPKLTLPVGASATLRAGRDAAQFSFD